MLTENFKKDVLLDPLIDGCDELIVVAGYATAATARQHLTGGGEAQKDPHFHGDYRLKVVVGMYSQEGIPRSDHDQFVDLCSTYQGFECRYVADGPPVHSKAYVWSKKGTPHIAFVGSANYSLSAARSATGELLVRSNPAQVSAYCNRIFESATDCLEIQSLRVRSEFPATKIIDISQAVPRSILSECPMVSLPLTERGKGEKVPYRSGLNWGQRPEHHREPSQAYISVPVEVQRLSFFPERGEYFTVITDDGQTFVMSRNQDQGKALHTPNNSQIGEYFRHRLGIPFGKPVTIDDLVRYGRKDISMYYIGFDTYYLDFSTGA